MVTLNKINFMSEERFDETITSDNELYMVKASSFDIPDYSRGRTVASGFVVFCRGYFKSDQIFLPHAGSTTQIYINGVNVGGVAPSAGYGNGTICNHFLPLKKGDVLTASGTVSNFTFYPCYGEKE